MSISLPLAGRRDTELPKWQELCYKLNKVLETQGVDRVKVRSPWEPQTQGTWHPLTVSSRQTCMRTGEKGTGAGEETLKRGDRKGMKPCQGLSLLQNRILSYWGKNTDKTPLPLGRGRTTETQGQRACLRLKPPQHPSTSPAPQQSPRSNRAYGWGRGESMEVDTL